MAASKQSLNIDREAILRAFTAPVSRPNSEWCVACGASASAGPELPRILEQQIAKDPVLLTELIRTDYVERLATKLSGPQENADWCVACGAGASKAPSVLGDADRTGSLTDAQIDTIAARLWALQGAK